MRQTSIDCYNKIKANGLLSKSRLQVYEALYKTELREQGVIYEKGEKKCNITGRNVIEWDLTDNLPIKLNVTQTIKQQKVSQALSLIESLGKRLNEPEKTELRAIWHLVKKI